MVKIDKFNGGLKVLGLSIVIAGAALGWGATWGRLDNKVANLENATSQKLNEEVYRANMKYLEDRLDRIEKKIDKLLDGRP